MTSAIRPSRYLSAQNLLALADAFEFAEASKLPLSYSVDIHCNTIGVSDDVHHFITRFFKLINDWYRDTSKPAAYIWVLENPSLGGLNLHALIHVPPDRRATFARKLRGWIVSAGGSWRKRGVRGKWLGCPVPGAESHLGRRLGKMIYLLKGADPEASKLLRYIEHKDQGVVRGKRCGSSESLGITARGRAGFTRVRSSRHGPVMRTWLLFSFEDRRLIGDRGEFVQRPRFIALSEDACIDGGNAP